MLLYVSYRVISFLTAVVSLPRDSRANWNELKSFSSQVSNTNKALLLSTGTINSIIMKKISPVPNSPIPCKGSA